MLRLVQRNFLSVQSYFVQYFTIIWNFSQPFGNHSDDDNTVVIAYKNTGYKNISVIRTISPGNRFSSYSFVLEEYRL